MAPQASAAVSGVQAATIADDPTQESSDAGDYEDDIDFVGGDDDSVDLAKTQKFERRAHAEGTALGTDEGDGKKGARRRRSRKGKRRTFKIPDDSIPQTPTPPAVTTAQQMVDALGEDEAFDAAATIQRPIVAAAGGPPDDASPTSVAGAPLIPAPLPAPKPPPTKKRDDDIYDAPTVLRGPPDDELRARLAALPDPTAPDEPAPKEAAAASGEAGNASSTDASNTDTSGTAATSSTNPDTAAVEGATPAAVAVGPSTDPVPTTIDDPHEDPHRRESAPGVFTDDDSIAVLRPVQVVNSLPPMAGEVGLTGESASPGDSSPPMKRRELSEPPARRPLPPPRAHLASDALLDEIEEIIPERMSLPGPTAETMAADFGPPSGTPTPAVAAPVAGSIDPTGDTAQQRPMSVAEADLALAEARAREAEAKALALEAKARAAAAKADAARNKSARPPKKPWYAVIFEDELVRTLDNPKKKDVEREATFIEECLRLNKGSRILDLACGAGVHAVELASRGYQVVGVDLSTTMLKLAEGYNTSRGTSVSFIQGDMRKLNLEGVFDGIYCWASSFGYFDDQQNAQVLERVARALRPGGMFALDVSNRDYVAPNSPSMAWFEKPGVVCMDEARFDFFTSRLHTKRMVLFDTGKSREVEMSMRLYTLTELGRLLQKVGFEVLEVSGHRVHRGAYFGSHSPRIIITSRRTDKDSEPIT